MAGGLFAIRKKFFYALGSYDEQMEIWGGENIEISFRVSPFSSSSSCGYWLAFWFQGWMCGAVLEIVPCSHVSHLFRKSSPYTFPGGVGDTLHSNLARVALVWMDEWKNFFFKIHPEVGGHAANQSVESRRLLRQQLNCHSFEWYLNNVWPSHFFPAHDRFVGKIRNSKTGKCLETPKAKGFSQPFGEAKLQTCILELYPQQIFIMTPDGYIATDDSVCLDAPDWHAPAHASFEIGVRIMACNTLERQQWKHDKKLRRLKHVPSGKCLDLPSKRLQTTLTLRPCDARSLSQEWSLERIEWASNTEAVSDEN